jgi:TolB-like protein
MADIFISYSSKDLERVKPLVAALEAKGWSVWWDRELVAGPSFDEEIEKALDGASCVVVVWSKNSIESRWVRTEANEGIDRDVLIPLLIDDVKPPLAFRIAQTAGLIGWPEQTGEFQAVVDGITRLLGKPTDDRVQVRNAIAVLPFANMSSDPEQEYFSDGMAEEIINGLVRFPDLNVIARTSSFQFKGDNHDIREIGERLNVSHILEGSVRTAGNRIRVTAQLILVRDGIHLWSNRFERELADVFILQDEITSEILKSLQGHLGSISEQPIRSVNPKAYSAYLQGRNAINRWQFDDAISSFERSIELDPQNADAFAMLVQILSSLVTTGMTPKEELQPLIEEYTAKGLSINPNQPGLSCLRANQLFFVDRDYQQAIDLLTGLVVDRPNDPDTLIYLAEVFAPLGRLDLSLVILRHQVELDPLNPNAHFQLGSYAIVAGEFDQARQSFENCVSLGGEAMIGRCQLAVETEDFETLRNLLAQWRDAEPSALDAYRPFFEVILAICDGDLDKAQSISRQPGAHQESAFIRSYVALWMGEIELALDGIEMALASSEVLAFRFLHGTLVLRRNYPEYFSHPRYAQILVDFGLDKKSISALRIPQLPF